MPWLFFNTSLLPSCPFLAPTYELAVQIISRPVISTLRQEKLPLANVRQYCLVCSSVAISLLGGSCRRIKQQNLLLTLQHTDATKAETTWESLGLQDFTDTHRLCLMAPSHP